MPRNGSQEQCSFYIQNLNQTDLSNTEKCQNQGLATPHNGSGNNLVVAGTIATQAQFCQP